MVFATGEAGAGKTALVTEFAHQAFERYPDLLVATGNCNVPGIPGHTVRTLPSNLRVAVWAWTHWLYRVPKQHRFADPACFGVLRNEQVLDLPITDDADTVVVLPHWDYEYQHFPSHATRTYAKTLAAHGVDVVGGSHSYVL